jgi:hypothetical protein
MIILPRIGLWGVYAISFLILVRTLNSYSLNALLLRPLRGDRRTESLGGHLVRVYYVDPLLGCPEHSGPTCAHYVLACVWDFHWSCHSVYGYSLQEMRISSTIAESQETARCELSRDAWLTSLDADPL